MTSEIVERLARIAHEELAGSDPDELIHHPAARSWEAPTEPRWRQWIELVEAMLRGLREPTDDMARGAQATGMGLVTAEARKEMFRAMIDAARPECSPRPMCATHPDRVSRVNLDGEEHCQECADAWVRGEGMHAAWLEAEEGKAP